MTNDDVLYSYRLRVLATAREIGSVAAACRLHGIHRSTLLSLEELGRPFRPGGLATSRAQAHADAQLDPGPDRASDHRLRLGPLRRRAGTYLLRARP